MRPLLQHTSLSIFASAPAIQQLIELSSDNSAAIYFSVGVLATALIELALFAYVFKGWLSVRNLSSPALTSKSVLGCRKICKLEVSTN